MTPQAEFDLDGARRIVRSTRTVEGGQPRLGSVQHTQSGGGVGGLWYPATNGSGSTILAASCVEVVPTAGKDFPAFGIQAPTALARYWPVIGQKEFADGVEGLVSWDQVATLRLDDAGTPGDVMGPSSSSDGALVTGGYGFEVLYLIPDEGDDSFAVCRQTPTTAIRFDTGGGGISAGSSKSVAVYGGDGTALGWMVSVYNYSSANMTASLDDCVAVWVQDRWVAVFEDCGP